MYGAPTNGGSNQNVNPNGANRPASMFVSGPVASHSRSGSKTTIPHGAPTRVDSARRPSHTRPSNQQFGTFAPKFIQDSAPDTPDEDQVVGIEGENDFSGKRYVWLPDPEKAFIKGWIIDDLDDGTVNIETEDGKVCWRDFLRIVVLNAISVSFFLIAHHYHHSAIMSMPRPSTRSIRPSSTRPVIWPS